MSDIERELREQFGALRDRDAESAPAFRSMWTRAIDSTRAERRRVPPYLWVAAAGLVVTAAGLAVRSTTRGTSAQVSRQAVSGTIAELMRWTAPTDGFLPAHRDSMRMAPAVLQSVLDGAAPLTTDTNSFKGD